MYRRLTALFAAVLVMALALTWVFMSMRAVMDVGGACASGGAYEIATPCPDNVAVFMTLGIPLMLVCAFIGSWIAVSIGAPDLLIPMWLLLFGSLGWNFLEYGMFGDDLVWGWIVCGVLFEAMALPALLFLLPFGNNGPVRLNPNPNPSRRGAWLLAYAVLGVVGAGLGWATFVAWN
ncbi:hypothetical protein [Nocardioides sp. SR21]|uniref:hypothetical protein n=1 Tax=Nocardioides sp. SR21 TaxID=2919501 RepID=UPI001FAADF9F|nr:hypothetical protein [Nocardioides sp. SR21]